MLDEDRIRTEKKLNELLKEWEKVSVLRGLFKVDYIIICLEVRQLSLYCLADELRQGCFVHYQRKKIKIYNLTLVGGKKKSWKVTFYSQAGAG